MFHHKPEAWKQLVETGMRQDWSWRKSAERYVEVYQRVSQRHAEKMARLRG
jgi:starch synthase